VFAVQMGKGKAVPVHTMNTCRRSGGVVPLVLNLGTVAYAGWFTSPAALPPHPHFKCRKAELS